MPVMNPPNSAGTMLVSVPVPQPVQTAPKAPRAPAPPQFKPLKLPPTVFLPYAMPAQQQRMRRPVKFMNGSYSPEQDEAFMRAVSQSGNDWTPLLMWADYLEESGHPTLAHVMREASKRKYDNSRPGDRGTGQPSGERTYPWTVNGTPKGWAFTAITHGIDSSQGTLHVHHGSEDDQTDHTIKSTSDIEPERRSRRMWYIRGPIPNIKQLAKELAAEGVPEVHTWDSLRVRRGERPVFGQPRTEDHGARLGHESTQMRRSVRFVRQEDLEEMLRVMHERPDDVNHRMMVADALEEAGKPAYAEMLRSPAWFQYDSSAWYDRPIGHKFVVSVDNPRQHADKTNKGKWRIWLDSKMGLSDDRTQYISMMRPASSESETKDKVQQLLREGALPMGGIAKHIEYDMKPTQMAAYRAPAGGMVVRGTYYQGGKVLPKEATEPVRASANPKKEHWIDRLIKKRRKKRVPPIVLPSEAGAC